MMKCVFDFILNFFYGRFDEPVVQRDMKMLPYKIVNKDGKPYIQVKIKDGEVKVFSPEEISAMILQKMKQTAESYLGKEIRSAVITVPGMVSNFRTYVLFLGIFDNLVQSLMVLFCFQLTLMMLRGRLPRMQGLLQGLMLHG